MQCVRPAFARTTQLLRAACSYRARAAVAAFHDGAMQCGIAQLSRDCRKIPSHQPSAEPQARRVDART